MAERAHAQLTKIVCSEVAQQQLVDVVGVERIGVLTQSKGFKPATDVHLGASTSGVEARYALRGPVASAPVVEYSRSRPVSLQELLLHIDG